MLAFADALKRALVGRPVRSDRLSQTLLPKRIALPVFASDALSSVSYAPDEILLTLSLAGGTALFVSPWIGLAVVVVMMTVVASYRQNVHAYPSGGGDYEVATANLGSNAGLTVASSLMVDYVLTVAVSISAGTQYAVASIPALRGYEVSIAVGFVVLLVAANLRGVKESGAAFAIPVYFFIGSIAVTAIYGFTRLAMGDLPQAASAQFTVAPEPGMPAGLMGIAGAFLILRAFSSGCAALTGVEAISNGVPSFKKPKSKNAATTLLMLGLIAITMLMAILMLAKATGVQYVNNPAMQLLSNGVPVGESYLQDPTIGQIARAVFDGVPFAFYAVAIATGVILVLAANTAFNGFPVLGSILARDGYLPRQLRSRGDRLAYSNGILLLAAGAIVLIVVFNAEVTRLIQLYIVGVFVSFTLSQLGMIKHWNRLLRTEANAKSRRRMFRSRAINSFGLFLTATVLVIVLVTKFLHGAWIAILAMFLLFVLMRGIRRHYDHVRDELALGEDLPGSKALPPRVHAIILISKLHKPTLRALAYARAARPSSIEALHVAADEEDLADLRREWDSHDLPIPLRVLDSPYREITRPVVDYVRSVRRHSPRDLVIVYVPEYVVGHWWEQVLHNQTSLRLKSRLHFTSGVVIASVPWQLASSQPERERERAQDQAALDNRRGVEATSYPTDPPFESDTNPS